MGMSPLCLERCWLSISITLPGESARLIFHLLTISCGREDMHIHEGGGTEREIVLIISVECLHLTPMSVIEAVRQN